MLKPLLWRLGLVLVVILWAAFSTWPPQNRSFLRVFQQQAKNQDADFAQLLTAVSAKKAKDATQEYENLRDAVMERKISLKKYFLTVALAKDDQEETLQEYLKSPAATAKEDPEIVAQANRLILRQLLHDAEGKIKLGLDLKGGSSFLLKMDLSKIDSARRALAQQKAVEIIRHRVDALGVSEPIIQPVGEDRLMVQIPGALADEQRAEARETLQKVSFLEFRIVYPNDDEMQQMLARGEFPLGYEVKELRDKRFNPKTKRHEWRHERLLVKDRPEQGLTGKYIKSAHATQTQFGEPEVVFEFNSEGARIFEGVTRENKGHRLAILLDGHLQSAPVIRDVISSTGTISGNFNAEEAMELANTLENPLEHPLEIQEEHTVSATLGADSVKAGFVAGVWGLGLVLVFMLLYYKIPGAVANVCLVANMIILIGALAQFGFTLTLPGIAGLILTIGMAVDANVLIYERLREELATGKSLRNAVPLAFRRTFWTILDSNLTTIITAVALIKFGAGPVLGFAVVLTTGIVTSVFSALVICHLIFDWATVRDTLKTVTMHHLIRNPNVNFLRWRNWAIAGSLALIVAGLVSFASRVHDHTIFGVDFAGGDSFLLKFEQKVSTEALTASLAPKGAGDIALQYQTQLRAGGSEILSVKTSFGRGDEVLKMLQAEFPQAKFTQFGQLDRVGPMLGVEFAINSTIGLILGLLGILVYVSLRFEFSFALGAIVALIHDVIITVGVMSLLGKQMTLPMIGAILTIAGYSINDTIVIFDRIREGLKIKTGSLEQIMNASINETLSRTLLTSSTSLITLLAIFFFGGKSLHDFSLALIVGIVTGTYSSIFIASPIVLLWSKRKGVEAGQQMASKPL